MNTRPSNSLKVFKLLKLIVITSSLLLYGVQAFAKELSIAVASNFIDPARDIASLFAKTTGYKISLSSGSTGQLYAQIANGAPFDVFLAADKKHALDAEEAGLAVKGTRFTYAQGKLVLWSTKNSEIHDGLAYLKGGAFARIAIANPNLAPYGLAAQQVLEYLRIWQQVQPKLVQGDTITQAFQFIATGNSEVGLIAYSQVKAAKNIVGTWWEIPQNYYAPIIQQAVLLQKGEHDPAARAFMDFLKSPRAQQIILNYGYILERTK